MKVNLARHDRETKSPINHQKHHYFNCSMHCYESPELRGLAQHCETHHVNTAIYFGKLKENGETNKHNAKICGFQHLYRCDSQANIAYIHITHTTHDYLHNIISEPTKLYTKVSL